MITGLHHVAISTADLEGLKDFYCDMFGLEEIFRYSWDRGDELADRVVGLEGSQAEFAYLRGPNAYLEIFKFTHPEPRPADRDRRLCDHGYTHICFEVDDVAAEHARLTAAGMRFMHEEPVDAGLLQMAYGFDPDGNVIELLAFPDRDQGAASSSLTGTDAFSTRGGPVA